MRLDKAAWSIFFYGVRVRVLMWAIPQRRTGPRGASHAKSGGAFRWPEKFPDGLRAWGVRRLEKVMEFLSRFAFGIASFVLIAMSLALVGFAITELYEAAARS